MNSKKPIMLFNAAATPLSYAKVTKWGIHALV